MSTSHALRTGGVVVATALAGILLAAPAEARPDPGTGGPDPVVVRPDPPRGSGVVIIDDDAVEYLQVGAGLLAGLALAGAGAAVVARRQHRDLSPV